VGYTDGVAIGPEDFPSPLFRRGEEMRDERIRMRV